MFSYPYSAMQRGNKLPVNSGLIRVNQPEPVKVKENPNGEPVAILEGPARPVTAIVDTWRIDDEWWSREEVSRIYYNVILASGQHLTIFKNLVSGSWYRQQY